MHPVYSHIICLMPRCCIPVILTLMVSIAMNIKYLLSRSTCAQFQKSLKKHFFICFCYPPVDVIINSHSVHDISSQIIEVLCSGNKFVSNKKLCVSSALSYLLSKVCHSKVSFSSLAPLNMLCCYFHLLIYFNNKKSPI